MSPLFRLFLIALLAMSLAGPLLSADLTVRWEHPTQRVDGQPIALTDIGATELRYAPCVEGPALGTPQATVSVPAPESSRTITGLTGMAWCVQARSIDKAGLASDWTGVAKRDALPLEPVLLPVYRVAPNGSYTTRPVYRVDTTGKLVNVTSRRVAVGADCDPRVATGASYYSVAGQVNALKPEELLPAGSFAYCVQTAQ